MTSVERIIEYTQLPTEHVKTVRKKVPADWPSKGHIVFDKVSLSYDKNLPNVLKEISVNINPSEKVRPLINKNINFYSKSIKLT